MDITIRNALPEDASEIARINIESWRTTYRGLIAESTLDDMKFEDYLKKWQRSIERTDSEGEFCLVAETKKDGIVGYARCGKNRNPKFRFDGEVFALYLLKEFQGKGIGNKIFLECVGNFRKYGLNSFLLFVLAENHPSRAFYESFHPHFTAQEIITIDKHDYLDVCYCWQVLPPTA